jgi:hypothetical protein
MARPPGAEDPRSVSARRTWCDRIAGCEGYRVDTPGGRLGYVEDVRRDPKSGRPAALVVRAGMRGTHLLDVPVERIRDVLPSRGLVIVL